MQIACRGLPFGLRTDHSGVVTTAHDVAAYIARELGRDPGRTKLQKLLYYSQVWSIVWDGEPLFSDDIEAWDLGPVVREVWRSRHGGDPETLSEKQRATVEAILDFYANFSATNLSDLTHREMPWAEANRNEVIAPERLASFYGGLEELRDCGKELPETYRESIRMLLRMTPEEVDHLYRSMETDEIDEGGLEWLTA